MVPTTSGGEPRTSTAAPQRAGRPHFSARTKARKRALDVLFEADLRAVDALGILGDRIRQAEPRVPEYTSDLVEGVVRHLSTIDARLEAALDHGWSLDRMPRVDRTLARLAIFEIDHADVPPRVAIAEALLLAGELSTDESPAFLNGVLSAVVKQPLMDEDEVEQVHRSELAADA